MTLNPSIFKAYDIRGVYHKDFELEDVKRIAQAFVKFTGAKTVVVGRDMRTSGDELTPIIIDGLLSQGVKVVSIGLCTTPMFNFAVADEPDYDGGIMVTASHNPAQFNGFKLSLGDALPIGRDTGMDKIKKLAIKGGFAEKREGGEVVVANVLVDYLNKIFSLVDKDKIKPMKIVVDAGNGMGGIVVPDLFKRLNRQIKMIPLYFELDGTFPHHVANPLKEENLVDLKKTVLEEKADLGIAYDADGDRIGFVDERAKTVTGDLITALIARKLLKNNPGEKVLYDVRCSNIVREVIKEAGGRSEMSMVGHALIKNMMKKTGALFAGELSSHFYYRDFYTVESGSLTVLHILEMMSEKGKKFSELADPLRKYFHSGEENSKVADKEGMIKKIEKLYKKEAVSTSHLDGLRLDFTDWWFSVRASNTEPLLRLIVEAKTKKLMEKKRDELLRIIRT